MRLKQACSIYGDYGLNISTDHYIDEGIPLIRTSDCDDYGRLNLNEVKCIPMQFAIGKLLKRGDLLFSRSGTIGRCIFIDCDIEATYAGYLVRFRPDQKCLLSKYAFYWAQSSHYWLQVHENTIESTIGNFNGGKFSSLVIPECKLETQKEIADFLDLETDHIDQLIRKKESFVLLVQEKKQALSDQILDGTILNLEKSEDKGWFGALPIAWPTRRGKFLFKEAQGRSDTGDEELLTVSHITGVTKRSEKDVNMFMAETMEGYKLVSKGDVIVNTMWAWMGAMGISPHDGLISPSYGVYRPIRKYFEDGYLDLILRSKAFIAESTRRSKGIHSSRLRLYPDAFLDILFPVPSIDEQKQILSEYNKATAKEDKLVELNTKSIELLKEFRASLIAEAVTGKLDIESWKKRGSTDERLDNIEESMRI